MGIRAWLSIGLAFFLVAPAGADAALTFQADFRQDGVMETAWPLAAGEAATFDIYVSNVPAPGLGAMGFKVLYDAGKLEVIQEETRVEAANWPDVYLQFAPLKGEIEMAGYRLDAGLAGDRIKLGTVRLQAKAAADSTLTLMARSPTFAGFVLADDAENPTVLDGDLGGGVTLAAIMAPRAGDVDGSGTVGLADAILVLRMIDRLSSALVHRNADVDGDGKIGLREAVYILQKVATLR